MNLGLNRREFLIGLIGLPILTPKMEKVQLSSLYGNWNAPMGLERGSITSIQVTSKGSGYMSGNIKYEPSKITKVEYTRG